jgi:hypothetical protein
MSRPKSLRRYTNLNVALDMLFCKRISLASYSSWVDANDRRCLDLYQHDRKYGFVGAACLSMAKETFHHWNVFANGPSGVCIHFNVAAFIKMFEGRDDCLLGPVRYHLLDDMRTVDASDIDVLPFLKRAGFTAEEEYRVIGFSQEKREVIHIPLRANVIRRITLSPLLHPALVQSTVDVIHNIKGWEDLRVIHSRLTDSRTWERRLHAFMKRHRKTNDTARSIERGVEDVVARRVVPHDKVTAEARAIVAVAKRVKK